MLAVEDDGCGMPPEVLVAELPSVGIELVRTHERPIDLLLTEMIMPEMDGRALAALIQDARPEIRVLCMSGYPGEAAVGKGMESITLLPKPFKTEVLARAVRDALDG
jgi:DNA-binding NtrC family response regulator